MSVRAAVVAQLERYDDEAWAALTSRGLLRRARKDLGRVEVAVLADDEQVLRLRVGPHEVSLDARGPTHASCSCPSGTTCQHVVAAGLWLASGADGGDSGAGTGTGTGTGTEDDTLHRELMGLDPDALLRHAGRPGYRWARQLVDDLERAGVRVESGRNVSITFSHPFLIFRYMGGGAPGLVPDTRLSAVEKYQVAAVLAYQRAHGAELADVEPGRPARAADDLDLTRSRLRATTSRLITDTVALGLSHLSASVHQRYETVAVWAQGAEYHRLALLLRRLADHVELLLERSARADEHRLLDEASIAYALVSALEAAATAGSAPARLVGRARNRYDAVRTMELLGLGAAPWRAASGYRGLTTLFWWPEQSRFVSLTDARPEMLHGFDPRARYASAGPWSGLSSPSAATGARVVLTDALLSAGGRLSGVDRTRAAVHPLSGEELADVLPVVDSWGALARDSAGLLDLPDPLRDWAVLRPARYGTAFFDPTSQALTWVAVDRDGVTLPLTVAYTAETAHLVDRVEDIAGDGTAEGALLVCRLRRDATGLSGEPLSLVHTDRPAGDAVQALHFAAPAGRRGRPRARGPGERVAQPLGSRLAVVPAALLDLRGWLVAQAERGTGAASPAALTAQLLEHHRRARGVGLDVFPAELAPAPGGGEVAAQLLRSHFLVLQTTALLTGETGWDTGAGGPLEPAGAGPE
ncbi:SWIM zinc finger domain-containing protein [Georgenia sp. EYE_87]|uniref:SWIM zinc finger family protein n=1 Tax=Georgenia sp. EYE_87 TaxID=2853448 RepID=UPI002004D4EA|nr:SWIM zinc finger family protein [Georgenia sp. EYE_87]MCK6212185.1 SWIM zinc finger domain-containing protein [Georgenia sp. EYE_87]